MNGEVVELNAWEGCGALLEITQTSIKTYTGKIAHGLDDLLSLPCHYSARILFPENLLSGGGFS